MVQKKTSKEDLYFTILNLMKEGKDPVKELPISKQKLYYYRKKLQELGFLKKDKNIWVILKSTKKDLEQALNWKQKKIRGHAFIWKVKIDRDYNWIQHLEKNNLSYNLVRENIPRVFINKNKVWLTKNSIVIYESRSFYGKNAVESRKYAVYGLIKTLNELQNRLGIQFKYYFQPVREHFGMIKNELARQCNDSGEKIKIRDTLDGEWFWIDDSTGMMGELETGGKGFTKDRAKLNIEVQNWYNDMKKTDFKVTPSFILETMNGIQKNQMVFDANMSSHLEVLEKIGNAIVDLQKEVKKLNERTNTSN